MLGGGCGDGKGVSAPELVSAPDPPRWSTYNASNNNEYICGMTVTPSSQSVTVGTNAYFSVYRQICSRSTGQHLYTDTQGTYWGSSNSNVASVGSATNYSRVNVR